MNKRQHGLVSTWYYYCTTTVVLAVYQQHPHSHTIMAKALLAPTVKNRALKSTAQPSQHRTQCHKQHYWETTHQMTVFERRGSKSAALDSRVRLPLVDQSKLSLIQLVHLGDRATTVSVAATATNTERGRIRKGLGVSVGLKRAFHAQANNSGVLAGALYIEYPVRRCSYDSASLLHRKRKSFLSRGASVVDPCYI